MMNAGPSEFGSHAKSLDLKGLTRYDSLEARPIDQLDRNRAIADSMCDPWGSFTFEQDFMPRLLWKDDMLRLPRP